MTVKGVVIGERLVGERDKFIDILTTEHGVVELTVKGARKINGKSGSATQLFSYSQFCCRESKNYLFLQSAEPICIFYGLRDSLSRICLACYFADIVKFCILPETQNNSVIRLFLNTLHFLSNGLRSEKMLKSIFELRFMSEMGFMPDILACHGCGVFEPDVAFFNVGEGCFYCKDCFTEKSEGWHEIKRSVLRVIRHITLSDFDTLYNFKVSEKTMKSLSDISEEYVVSHLERNFQSLDFYKSIREK